LRSTEDREARALILRCARSVRDRGCIARGRGPIVTWKRRDPFIERTGEDPRGTRMPVLWVSILCFRIGAPARRKLVRRVWPFRSAGGRRRARVRRTPRRGGRRSGVATEAEAVERVPEILPAITQGGLRLQRSIRWKSAAIKKEESSWERRLPVISVGVARGSVDFVETDSDARLRVSKRSEKSCRFG